MGVARGNTGSRGPGHLWVPQEVEGRGRAAESGVFLWVVVESSKEREGLGKGRVLTPRCRLGSSAEPRVGAGRGWGGEGSRWAARAPGPCGGRGSVAGRGSMKREGEEEEEGRGRAGPTHHASSRKARAHSQISAYPAGSGAQAQRRGHVEGKATLGQRVPRRDISGRRERYGPGRGRGWGRGVTLLVTPFLPFVLAVREAHSVGW